MATLKAKRVDTVKDGVWTDAEEEGLILRVRNEGRARSWYFRWKQDGKVREIGLGSAKTTGILQARGMVKICREAIRNNQDPAAVLRAEKEQEILTFRELALQHIAAKAPEWRNEKHAWQWTRTMEMFVFPVIGKLTADKITTDHILRVLTPIWSTKLETAMRVRQRIEAVMSRAIALKMRPRGEGNPAAWDGHLEHLLPSPKELRKVSHPIVHHAAAKHPELSEIMKALRDTDSVGSLCLQFIILTAVRSGEARNATWEEIDWKEKTWTIPASRMKAKRSHVVPLSAPAMAILRQMVQAGTKHIFASPKKPAQGITDIAIIQTLHRIRPDITVHGCRSSFRDWCSEMTSATHEVIEMSLAHTIKDKTEAAYFRSDLIAKRRELMDAWAEYLVGAQEPVLRQVI